MNENLYNISQDDLENSASSDIKVSNFSNIFEEKIDIDERDEVGNMQIAEKFDSAEFETEKKARDSADSSSESESDISSDSEDEEDDDDDEDEIEIKDETNSLLASLDNESDIQLTSGNEKKISLLEIPIVTNRSSVLHDVDEDLCLSHGSQLQLLPRRDVNATKSINTKRAASLLAPPYPVPLAKRQRPLLPIPGSTEDFDSFSLIPEVSRRQQRIALRKIHKMNIWRQVLGKVVDKNGSFVSSVDTMQCLSEEEADLEKSGANDTVLFNDLGNDSEEEEYETIVRKMADPLFICPCCDKALRDPVELLCSHVMERRCADAARQKGMVLPCPVCGARQYCCDVRKLKSAHYGNLARRLPNVPQVRWRFAHARAQDLKFADEKTKAIAREQRRRQKKQQNLCAKEQINSGLPLTPTMPLHLTTRPPFVMPDVSVPPPGMKPLASYVAQQPAAPRPPAAAASFPQPMQTMSQMQSMLATLQNMMLQPGATNNPQLMTMMQQMLQMVQQQQHLEALQTSLKSVNKPSSVVAAPASSSSALSTSAFKPSGNAQPPAESNASNQQQQMKAMYEKALELYQKSNSMPWVDVSQMKSMMSQIQTMYSQMQLLPPQHHQNSSAMEEYSAQYAKAMQCMMNSMMNMRSPGATAATPTTATTTTTLDVPVVATSLSWSGAKKAGDDSASAKAFSGLGTTSNKTELEFPSLGLTIPRFVPQTPRYIEPKHFLDNNCKQQKQPSSENQSVAVAALNQPPKSSSKLSSNLPLPQSLTSSASNRNAVSDTFRAPLAPSNLLLGTHAGVSSPNEQTTELDNTRHLLLSGLPINTKAADVKNLCSCFGRVNNIKVVMKPTRSGGGDDDDRPPSPLMAYVTMENAVAAQSALSRLDRQSFRGFTLRTKALVTNPFLKDVRSSND